MPLKSNEDGSYVASWVPSTSGNYLIQVFIDGKSAGMVHTHCGVVVLKIQHMLVSYNVM